ncbi:excisionase family DNA-binding protein [Nitrincola sp. MINF-07-Sa-05]|uniref:excisionase family DNA-binding protein n=1 Tax=Nitrincola salilacus TaxID=3400273 RepID=UPI0039183CFE
MSVESVVRLPTADEVEVARSSSRTLAKYAHEERVTLTINGRQGRDEVILPGAAMDLLLNILSELSQGNAISVMPIHAELSTQEAANLLNVSRPYLVKLLETGVMAFKKVGTHRRILAKDLLAYKSRIDAERSVALDELAELSQLHDMGYD